MNIRAIATPLTIGSFILMAVTGVLMFFHKDMGLNKAAHEWLSWAFLASVALHLFGNMTAFTRYFKSPLALGLIGIFIAILAGSFFIEGKKGGSPVRGMITKVQSAPIEALSPLTGQSPDEMVVALNANGFVVENAKQSIKDIANGDKEKSEAALGVLFANSGPEGAPKPKKD